MTMATEMAVTPQYSKQTRKQSVIPLIVRQILSCEQNEYKLFGIPVHVACLVGIIKNIQVDTCQITFSIEDYSGQLKALLCVENDSELPGKLSCMKEGRYAQVFGSIRVQNNEKVFFVLKVLPVDDADLITCHLLQAICVRLEAEVELKKQVSSANSAGAALADALSSDEITPLANTLAFTSFQRAVFNIVQSEISDNGISKINILKQFPSYQGHEVNQALEYLIDEGIIYPTIDQNHFKAINNF